jgi:hypothetical protein
MKPRTLLADAFGRIQRTAHQATEGLDTDALAFRVDPGANSIAWLVWHMTRIQDHHVSEVASLEQAWVSGGWHTHLGRPADPSDTGYGHTPEEVAAIRPDGPEALLGYHDAVTARSLEFLDTVEAADLDTVVDRSYDPPVTLGVRLVSVVNDNLQHAGQARFVRGILERRT